MPALERNIVIEQGAKFSFAATLYRADPSGLTEFVVGGERKTFTARNLTGWTGRAHVRETFESSTTLATMTVTLGGTAGTVTATLGADVTAALTAGWGVWDLEIVETADVTNVERKFAGTVQITREVTR